MAKSNTTDEEFRRHWRETRQEYLSASGKFSGHNTRRKLQESLAHRWLVHSLFFHPILAFELLLDGQSRLAEDAMAVANFAICILEENSNSYVMVRKQLEDGRWETSFVKERP